MIDKNTVFNVTNRSGSVLTYNIPDERITRIFQPGETKRIGFEELEKLRYTKGGAAMMVNYLQIQSEDLNREMGIRTEPEYYLNERQIIELIKTGSLDAFLDFLDFAPAGSKQMLKDLCIKLPLEDYNKRKAISDKLGFNIDSAIAIAHMPDEDGNKPAAQERRVKTEEKVETGRRTTPKYTVAK